MVHQPDPLNAVRRTVTWAARPALAPLRAAAATLHPVDTAAPDDAAPGAVEVAAPVGERPVGERSEEPDGRAHGVDLDELAAMRDELSAAPGAPAAAAPSERAERATRTATAYLAARRARLRRELRELG